MLIRNNPARYAALAAQEPRLHGLLDDARAASVRPGCAEQVFAARFKARVARLAGFGADVAALASAEAYEVVYATVLAALEGREVAR